MQPQTIPQETVDRLENEWRQMRVQTKPPEKPPVQQAAK